MKLCLSSALLLVFFVHPHPALARLGEDEVQCEERYGFAKKEQAAMDKAFPLVTGTGATTRTYIYQGWRIRIGFLDGIAVREQYWKVTAPGRSATVADYEATAILEGEKGTGAWQPKGTKLSFNLPQMLADHLQQAFIGKTWIRTDGKAAAMVDSLHLAFESLAAIQHDADTKRMNEEKQRASVPAF